jgi:hypothetical protein
LSEDLAAELPAAQGLPRPDRRRAYRLARAANAALGVPPELVAPEILAFERGARVVSAYASERMMPRRAFLALAGDAEPCWDLVKELGEAFDASLTAAALRFVSLHPRAACGRAPVRRCERHGRPSSASPGARALTTSCG